MPHYNYLIVGGGMTADAAARGIRSVDANGSMALFSAEPDPPYSRPMLSKGLWRGKPLEKAWRGTAELGATLHLGSAIQSLDTSAKQVRDVHGAGHTYDQLLLATGGSPRRFNFGGDQIIYFRTLEDYRRLQALSERGEHFTVIGGGFIGSEIAAALAMNGKKVTILFPEAGINARLFPPDLAAFLNDYYRQKGVEVLAGELVSGMAQRGQQSVVRTQSGREIVSDGVVAGIGILPNLELARSAEVAVDDGILVDEFLRTNAPDVFAAGDGVSFHSKALGKRMRVEHEDHALTTGMIAGQNMANSLVSEGLQAYHHLPFFYSDLFDLGYEAVGELDPALDIVADWQTPFRKGTVYYLKSGRVRGVLLWDVWGKVDAARQMIEAPGPFTEEELMGRLAE